MDKIKSVLHGHKKDQDAAHDPHDPPRAQQGKHAPLGQPVYNIKTTSGAPYTELAHSNASARPHGHESHGQPEYIGTDGATGTNAAQSSAPVSTTPTGSLRPDPQPHGTNQEASIASIKSGVIGFGPEESQGHAAMSTHNPSKSYMASDQVVGSGSPGTAGMTEGRGMQPGPDAHTDPQANVAGSQPAATGLSNYAGEPQPYESILRQESYTADTDRSFPLAGGVTSNPHQHPSHATHASEGLAGAAVAATAIGASHTTSKSEEKDIRDQAAQTRQATYGDSQSTTVPNTTAQTGTSAVNQPESEHHPTVLPAATAVASNASSFPSTTQEKRLETDSTETILPTTEPVGNCERPINPRLESRHRHIPGEYIATPSDESKMFPNYDYVTEPASHHTDGNVPIQSSAAAAVPAPGESSVSHAPTTGSHELRHTGTLEEPRPRSADSHHARDAAITGGLLAGAAGLGAHEASQNHERRDVRSDSLLYEDLSPYAGKTLDPRVLGDKSKMEEQRFDPDAKAAHDMDPVVSEPPISHEPSRDNVATGVSAARDSAEDVVEAYTNHRMTQPRASMPEQRYDPAVSSARASNPVASKSQYDYNNPVILSNVNRTDPNDHVNRNAAFTGAGLAGVALGAGAYAREPHAHATQELPLRQKEEYAPRTQGGPVSQPVYPVQDTTQTSWPLPDTTTYMSYPDQGTLAPHNTHVEDPNVQPYGAVQKPASEEHDTHKSAMLGGAVGAAGLGGAAYMDHRYQNQQEADDRLRKIALDREEEERLRERESGKGHETDEKKHKVLGFLHRDKSKREKSSASPESSPRHSKDHSARNSKDYAEDSESPRWKGKHLLHKDPPKGHPAREYLDKSHHADPYAVGKREHVGTDGPIGNPDAISGDRETRKGVYGAHPATDLDHNPTTIEPHTGLPMNTEQYGTGFGGTDGNPAIHGQHDHPGAMSDHPATNWEAIRKADTPY